MTAFYILISVILLLLLAVLSVSLWIYFIAFYNKKDRDVSREVLRGPDYDEFHDEMVDIIDRAMKIPFEEVRIRSYDGLSLYGRVYFQKEGAPFHIQFNGYKGNGIRDFSGGLQLALASGGNVLLVDQRSHGRSDGHTICFGVKERFDVKSWTEYVIDRFGRDTIVFIEGVSMGAATVLMASDTGLPGSVRGIVADCPYSSPFGIIYEVGKKTVRSARLMKPFIFVSALIFGHFNIFKSSAENAVKNTEIPVLLIHGTGDHFVPYHMSEAIYAANPEMITFVSVEGAPHGLSCLKDHKKYENAVNSFWNSCAGVQR